MASIQSFGCFLSPTWKVSILAPIRTFCLSGQGDQRKSPCPCLVADLEDEGAAGRDKRPCFGVVPFAEQQGSLSPELTQTEECWQERKGSEQYRKRLNSLRRLNTVVGGLGFWCPRREWATRVCVENTCFKLPGRALLRPSQRLKRKGTRTHAIPGRGRICACACACGISVGFLVSVEKIFSCSLEAREAFSRTTPGPIDLWQCTLE